MKILIKNIRELAGLNTSNRPKAAGKEMSILESLSDAYLYIDNGKIRDLGEMMFLPDQLHQLFTNKETTVIDAAGRTVLPAWCDSHTHLVYPASREIEYMDKIRGLSYEEIARRGGGILNSARKMKETSEEQLFQDAQSRIREIISFGTGAVEIKSGYGLDTGNELKMLRVIKRLKENMPVTIKATFLGAHAVPLEFKADQGIYVDKIIGEMIPRVAEEKLADYIDVFCDKGFFTVEDTERILEAGAKYGLAPKIHANELGLTGGVQVGVKHRALSVDHLEHLGDEEIAVLNDSVTMPTILPGASFFLGIPYAPARKMIEAGLPLAMASDFNPGSSPSGNMQFILSMGSINYKLLPEEGINAITLNTAYAMGVEDELGSIGIGKKANVLITEKIPSLAYLPYYYGSNKIWKVILNGKIEIEHG